MKPYAPLTPPFLPPPLACGGGGGGPTPPPPPALPLPAISAFTATPATINPGQSSTLAWTVSGATTLSLSGQGNVTGSSLGVTPASTTTYTLTATNASGSATAQATVTVHAVAPPVRSTWTRVADHPAQLAGAVAFTLGNRAYVGTGERSRGVFTSDFWEFNPESQVWTPKAPFPGAPMSNACAFSLGSLGYVGLGRTPATSQGLWAYDASLNTWTRKADFPGEPRIRPMAVSGGGKGFVMGGLGAGDRLYKDLWAYDPALNTWTRKTDFPGPAKTSPLGFALGDKLYVCLGEAATAIDPSLWEYDIPSDRWTQRRSFPGTPRWGGLALSLGTLGFVGTGGAEGFLSDLWAYDPTLDTWTAQAPLPTAGRAGAVAFTLGEDIYLGLGSLFHPTTYPSTCLGDVWKTAPTGLLGQALPGNTPKIFNPSFLVEPGSTVFGATLAPDGKEFMYTVATGTARTILTTRRVDGAWTVPAAPSFTLGHGALEPHFTHDNRTVYFGLFHPIRPGLYAADRTPTGWSAPRYVGEGMFVSSSWDGQLYVTYLSTPPSAYLAKVVLGPDGQFQRLERLRGGMDTLRAQYPNQAHPCIAPDGSYLLFDVEGGAHLFVCFRLGDGTWGPAIDLARHGLDARLGIPTLTPDGKVLFFGNPVGDLYWVSTDLLQRLRPN